MDPQTNILRNRKVSIFIGCVIFVIISIVIAKYLPRGIDWYMTLRPAAQAVLSFKSPYAGLEAPYPYAPWGILPLLPLAVLPEDIGRGFLLSISLVSFAYTALKMGAKPITLGVFLLSPPILHSLLNSSLDWLPLLGFVLPPTIGLFFLAVKPQVGSVVAIFWLVEAWRRGKLKEVIRTFGPIVAALALSFLVFGFWPTNMIKATQYTLWWDASLWPASIPVGLALLTAALRKRKIQYAIAASPCLSPHVLFHSWSGALVAIVASAPETIAAVLGCWILVILRAFTGG